MDLQNASLFLKTSDLPNGSISQYGECDAKNSSFTWYNINLRTLLGDMYNKYDAFNLCLNTISSGLASNLGSQADDKNVIVKISGLPWLNQSYDVKSQNNTPWTVMGTFLFTSTATATQYYYSNNIATFGKNQEQVNISIRYTRVVDDATSFSGVSSFPNTIFVFDIIGIPKESNNLNASRSDNISRL